jgi:predicted DNA-binding transcriptional regulator AlpA
MPTSTGVRRIRTKPSAVSSETVSSQAVRRSSHVQPRCPVIDLRGPGRLRTAHVLALCGISHSTLYARLKRNEFPPPDGMDGGRNYWNTRTINAYLEP